MTLCIAHKEWILVILMLTLKTILLVKISDVPTLNGKIQLVSCIIIGTKHLTRVQPPAKLDEV